MYTSGYEDPDMVYDDKWIRQLFQLPTLQHLHVGYVCHFHAMWKRNRDSSHPQISGGSEGLYPQIFNSIYGNDSIQGMEAIADTDTTLFQAVPRTLARIKDGVRLIFDAVAPANLRSATLGKAARMSLQVILSAYRNEEGELQHDDSDDGFLTSTCGVALSNHAETAAANVSTFELAEEDRNLVDKVFRELDMASRWVDDEIHIIEPEGIIVTDDPAALPVPVAQDSADEVVDGVLFEYVKTMDI